MSGEGRAPGVSRDEVRQVVQQWCSHPNQLAVLKQWFQQGLPPVEESGPYTEIEIFTDVAGKLSVLPLGTVDL